jgi:hypothetical protein
VGSSPSGGTMTKEELYMEVGAKLDPTFGCMFINIVNLKKHMKFEKFLENRGFQKEKHRPGFMHGVYVSFFDGNERYLNNTVFRFRRGARGRWKKSLPNQWLQSSIEDDNIIMEFIDQKK